MGQPTEWVSQAEKGDDASGREGGGGEGGIGIPSHLKYSSIRKNSRTPKAIYTGSLPRLFRCLDRSMSRIGISSTAQVFLSRLFRSSKNENSPGHTGAFEINGGADVILPKLP